MLQSPHVADTAPNEPFLTGYDEQHLVIYLRLLDAESEGADWRKVAKIVLKMIRTKSPSGLSVSGRAISPAPDG
jgi:hypothetical protein